jgi:hypothetical protein
MSLAPVAPFAEASVYAGLWRDLPSSDYGMASKMERQEEEGKRKVGSKNSRPRTRRCLMFDVDTERSRLRQGYVVARIEGLNREAERSGSE